MADEKTMAQAQQVYKDLCTALDNRDWHYEKDEENLVVHFSVSGDDLPMRLIMMVDADRQLVRVLSPLPFKMSEEKRMEGAIATCAATYNLADGSFDYDLENGQIFFRLTASFRESTIGDGLFQYLISCCCATVDQYNDQFLAIDKGMLSIADFMEKNA